MKVWDRAGIELATPGSAVRLASVADTLPTALRGPVILADSVCWLTCFFTGNIFLFFPVQIRKLNTVH